jgi:hypothetical protein
VYRVAYEWMLEHRANPVLIGDFIEQAFAGVPQYFHDVSNNGSIGNPHEGWAHAAVLVQYLNRRCLQRAEGMRHAVPGASFSDDGS